MSCGRSSGLTRSNMDDANVARMRSAVQNFLGNPDFRTTRQALYPKRLDVLPRVRVRSDHCPCPGTSPLRLVRRRWRTSPSV